MLDFRCKMLDERGGILFSADIAAASAEDAIRHASEVLRTSNQASPSRRVYAFEVWSDSSRLFPPPLNAKTVPRRAIPRAADGSDEAEDLGVVLSE
jgi:hypothetical protein